MTLQDRNDLIQKIFENELIPLMSKKGQDYSGTQDCWSNLKDFGVMGIVVRLGDKYHRLKNFYRCSVLKVFDETVEDTLKDLIIYGFLALCLKRSEEGRYDKSETD